MKHGVADASQLCAGAAGARSARSSKPSSHPSSACLQVRLHQGSTIEDFWRSQPISNLCLCRSFKEALGRPFWTALGDETVAGLCRGFERGVLCSPCLCIFHCACVDAPELKSLLAQIPSAAREPGPGWLPSVHRSGHWRSTSLLFATFREAARLPSLPPSCPSCLTWRTSGVLH